MQPANQTIVINQRARFGGQGQEGCLAGILGIRMIAADSAAGGKDHPTVPMNEDGKRIFVSLGQEAL